MKAFDGGRGRVIRIVQFALFTLSHWKALGRIAEQAVHQIAIAHSAQFSMQPSPEQSTELKTLLRPSQKRQAQSAAAPPQLRGRYPLRA